MSFPFSESWSNPQTPMKPSEIEVLSSHGAIIYPPYWPKWATLRRLWIMIGISTVFLWMLQFPYLLSLRRPDRVPFSEHAVEDYFSHFEGHQDCGIISSQLYTPPNLQSSTVPKYAHFCPNRARLLSALSSGGRHGFDAPYVPAGCHYRWYTTTEICMILERFESIIFIGDENLKHQYAAFNIFLREDLAFGGLKQQQQWEEPSIEKTERTAVASCRCNSQLVKPECAKHLLTDSAQLTSSVRDEHKSPYFCNRTPHTFLPLASTGTTSTTITNHAHTPTTPTLLTTLLKANRESYKPSPIILSTTSSATLDEYLAAADAASRVNVPFLWIGPDAVSPSPQHRHQHHTNPVTDDNSNEALWHKTLDMRKAVRERGVEGLGMWNLTVQANDPRGDLRVKLVQAMMIVNWLARVDST